MKEGTQHGPLMDQYQKQKGLLLPQIKTVFGTAEDFLEDRTESNISNNEDTTRNGVTTGDDFSGMMHDALLKARRATESLSPHNQGSSHQKKYSSFFPSLENMISTSQSTTLQHAQALLAGSTLTSPTARSEREQPDGAKNEPSANLVAAAPKKQEVRPYETGARAARGTTSPTMKPNTSDFVFRKVENEIENAKKIAQQAFNRVKGGGGASDNDVIDLTDAKSDDRLPVPTTSQNNHREREMAQESFSEGQNSTWAEESERPLDSVISDDYGLVFDYATTNASMSSLGQLATPFCSLDNPLIRVMEDKTGMNIIDLTNVVEDALPGPIVNVHFRAASPAQASLASVGTEDYDMLNTTTDEKTNDNIKDASKTSETTNRKGIRSYPILPVKQESVAKTPEASSPKSDTKKAENKTIPTVATVNQGDSRAARLRKLRQPMHTVKKDSHEDSQGTPDENDKIASDNDGEEGTEKDQASGEDSDIVVNEKPESPRQEVSTEIANDHAVEKEVAESYKELESIDNDSNEEPVSDQQVEDALIDTVETSKTVDDFQSAKEEPESAQEDEDEAREVVKGQSSLESGFDALIDSVKTADVVDNAARCARSDVELTSSVQQEESDAIDSTTKLANGFDKLLSFFRDQDEINFVTASHNVIQKSKKSLTTDSSKMQEESSTEQVVEEAIEVEENGTISQQTAKQTESEFASEEQPPNETHETEKVEENKNPKEEGANNEVEAKETQQEKDGEPNSSPREAISLVNALGNFGATGAEGGHAVEGNEASTNDIEREAQDDFQVAQEQQDDAQVSQEQQDGESKHPLFAIFDAALGFMETKENQTRSAAAPIPPEADGPEDQQQYSENFNKSGESNEKNSLIEDGVSQSGQEMPSPLPSQYTADDEYYNEPEASEPSARATEDFHYQARMSHPIEHEEKDSNLVSDPLSSLYRPPEPEEELESESTRVTIKDKYDEPPTEYSTRPTEDIINDNKVDTPIPQLSVLEPTDEIQKLQNSIMGESVTRRFNACGALKMFAMNKSNQLALARTDGFFDALIVALTTDLVGKDREAAFGTRTRALEILLKICIPKENRVIIFYHPDLIESIVNCVIEDAEEIRLASCSVLATLAKSGHLREPLAQVDGLLNVLADSLLGLNSQKPTPIEGKEVHENDENYTKDEFSSGSESLSDNISSSGSETSFGVSSRTDDINRNKHNAAKLKQKELQEKKKETTKQVSMSACATLLHLSKQCAAGHFLCHNTSLLDALLILSQQFDHPMHSRCLEILCNLTRLPANNEILAEHPSVVPVMLRLSTSEKAEDRVWALRMLENISASKAGKQVLVSTFALELLSMSVLRTQVEEQKAAMAALFNLSTDPGCLMAITSTRDVLSSLVLVAQDMNTMSDVRIMACDTLATIGLWLQKLAGKGTVPDGVKERAIPSNVTFGWNRWE